MVEEPRSGHSPVNGLRGKAIQKMGSNPILAFMTQAKKAHAARKPAPAKKANGVRKRAPAKRKSSNNGLFMVSTRKKKAPSKKRGKGKDIDLGNEDSSSEEDDYEIDEEDLRIEVADNQIEYASEPDELERIEQQLSKRRRAKRGKKKSRRCDSSEESSESDGLFEEESSDEEIERRYSKQTTMAITAAQLISGEKVVISDDEEDQEKGKPLETEKKEDQEKGKPLETEKEEGEEEVVEPPIIPEDIDLDDPHFLLVFRRFCEEALTVEDSRTEFMQQMKTYCTHSGETAHKMFHRDYLHKVYNGRKLTKNSECDLLFTVLINNTMRLLTKFASYRRRNRREMDTLPDQALYANLFTDEEEEESETGEEAVYISDDEEEEQSIEEEELVQALTWKEIKFKARTPSSKKFNTDDAIKHVHTWAIGQLADSDINNGLISAWKRLNRLVLSKLPKQQRKQDSILEAQVRIFEEPERLRSVTAHYGYLKDYETFYAIVTRLYRLAYPYQVLPEQL